MYSSIPHVQVPKNRAFALSIAVSLLLLHLPSKVGAQQDRYGLGDGSDGAFVASASSVVNLYTALTASAAAQSTTLALASSAGLAVSDLLLVWQTQGGTYTSGVSTSIDLVQASVGHYELARIVALNGNSVEVDHGLENSYALGAQVIRVPEFTEVSVPEGAQITASAWNGVRGGVVAFLARGSLTLGGSIQVDGRGFRGGSVLSTDISPCTCECTTANSPLDDLGCASGVSRRGEGLERSTEAFGLTACGRGNRANGGGGGGHHNAGGGGGGNGSAGSVGGDAWCKSAGNLSAGSGGGGVEATLLQALSFGGGGGAGQQNNGLSTSGGNGGGVVFLRARTMSGSGTLRANGQSAAAAGNDGAGGGGAGGSILVQLAESATCGGLQAIGGNGGNAQSGHGAGGAGGGGRVRLQASEVSGCSVDASGGAGGTGNTFAQTLDSISAAAGSSTSEQAAFGCQPGQCPNEQPACDESSRLCRACAQDNECSANTPACAPSGLCVQCTATQSAACQEPTSQCDPQTFTCVAPTPPAGPNPTGVPNANPVIVPSDAGTTPTSNAGASGGAGNCQLHPTSTPSPLTYLLLLLLLLLLPLTRRRRTEPTSNP